MADPRKIEVALSDASIRNIANQFGTSLTELRRMTMEENYRNKFKMINLNESNQFKGDILDWWNEDDWDSND